MVRTKAFTGGYITVTKGFSALVIFIFPIVLLSLMPGYARANPVIKLPEKKTEQTVSQIADSAAPLASSSPDSHAALSSLPGSDSAGKGNTTAVETKSSALRPDTKIQRQAYASGVSVWRDIENSLKSQREMGINLDTRYVIAGLQDMAARRPLQMTKQEIDAEMSALNAQYTDRLQEIRQLQEAEGTAYRITFSKQKGAISDGGCWYLIADKGEAKQLKATDQVELLVTGTLPDGTVFDPSGQNGQIKKVRVDALLPAVANGLQKVGEGAHLTIVVPPGRGYGDAGLPPLIPGGATLIYDITVKTRITADAG